MERVFNYTNKIIKLEVNILDAGISIKNMAKVNILWLIKQLILDNFKIINFMDMDHENLTLDKLIKVIGKIAK